jgi:hypothetical protein
MFCERPALATVQKGDYHSRNVAALGGLDTLTTIDPARRIPG